MGAKTDANDSKKVDKARYFVPAKEQDTEGASFHGEGKKTFGGKH